MITSVTYITKSLTLLPIVQSKLIEARLRQQDLASCLNYQYPNLCKMQDLGGDCRVVIADSTGWALGQIQIDNMVLLMVFLRTFTQMPLFACTHTMVYKGQLIRDTYWP